MRLELVGLDGAKHAVKLISCPVSLPHSSYAASKGLVNADEVAAAQEKFGTNVLSVATPR